MWIMKTVALSQERKCSEAMDWALDLDVYESRAKSWLSRETKQRGWKVSFWQTRVPQFVQGGLNIVKNKRIDCQKVLQIVLIVVFHLDAFAFKKELNNERHQPN